MKLKFVLVATAAFLSSVSHISASDEIETIIVTENRIPTVISDSLSAVTVLNREDIARYQASDLFDLMSRIAGVSMVRNGGRGTPTSLSLRGNQGDHSLFLVDGVRIGSATLGSATLGLLNVNSIERIEVVRGPKSNLYGADAIGGVVNIITRQSEDDKDLSISSSVGTNSTTETTIVSGFKSDRHSYMAVLNTFNTQGIDNTESISGLHGDKDAHSNHAIALNYQYQISDSAKWKVAYNKNDTETEYDADCYSPSWAMVDCSIYTVAEITSLSSRVDFDINANWHSSFQLGRSSDKAKELADNIDISTTTNGGMFDTTKTEATWVNYMQLSDGNFVTLGLDYQKDHVNSFTVYDQTSRYNQAAFLQYQVNLGEVDTSFGVRFDDNQQFGGHTTSSLLVGVDVNENLRLTGSYGEGFKAPTFNDLYYPNYGNPDFVPEQSENYEIGLKASWGVNVANVALFNNQLENLIQYNPATFLTDQTARVEISGIEFNMDTEIAGWAIGVSGMLIDPENETNGKLLRRRAQRSLSVDADYSFGNLDLGVTLQTQSHSYDDVSNTVRLGGYTTLALRADYRLNNHWSLKAKVDNLTDKAYTTAMDFSLGKYRSLGREIMFTIAYSPNF